MLNKLRWFFKRTKISLSRMVKRYSLLSAESVQYGKFFSDKTYVSRSAHDVCVHAVGRLLNSRTPNVTTKKTMMMMKKKKSVTAFGVANEFMVMIFYF